MDIFEKYREFTKKHAHLRPRFEIIPLTEKQYGYQFVGGQIYGGKLYGIPNSSEHLLIYDTESNEMKLCGKLERLHFK